MKKKNSIKKEIKKIKKPKVLDFKKKNNQNEVDLWAEIRTNVKPLVKAYHKFSEKRKIAKQKEELKKLKEEEQQRLREEESLRIQVEEEKRLVKEKKAKEEKQRKLKLQEEQKLEDKRIIDERDERIRQEQIYRERLIKGDEERIKLLARVNESREEEKKLREERNLEIKNKFVEEQDPKGKEQKLKEQEQKLKEQEQRLKEQEQRLNEKEQILKEEKEEQILKKEIVFKKEIEEQILKKEKEEQILKEEKKINLKRLSESEDDQKRKKLNGTVLWFNDDKGYGFIKSDDKEKDIFIHFSAVQNSGLEYLKKDEQLTFEVENSEKGLSAVNLQKTLDELSHSHLKIVK